jgi:hypothetical protein
MVTPPAARTQESHWLEESELRQTPVEQHRLVVNLPDKLMTFERSLIPSSSV